MLRLFFIKPSSGCDPLSVVSKSLFGSQTEGGFMKKSRNMSVIILNYLLIVFT